MNKENKDNLTDLVGMLSQEKPPKDEGSQQPPGTLVAQDGKPVTLGMDELQTTSLPNTGKRSNRASDGFLSLFGLKYKNDGSDLTE